MTLIVLISVGLILLALLPCLMFVGNLQIYKCAPKTGELIEKAKQTGVSVLIPARNEAEGIGKTLGLLLQSNHANFEIIVLDDHSEDETAAIVSELASKDNRVRLTHSKELPAGWNGKQHACWQLAHLANHSWLLFLDADVHVQSDALTRVMSQMIDRPVSLLSGFPRQETGTFSEKLLIPMMHLVLLGYLPVARMRATTDPGFSAGCGQLFLASAEDYFRCGGHEKIAASRHDGIKLPRLFRQNGMKTDLFDATDICSCRMYRNCKQVTTGLLKNATEGMANSRLIVPFTILLGGAYVLPALLLGVGWLNQWPLIVMVLLSIATLLGFVPRWLAAVTFQQSWVGVLLNPFAVAWFLSLQWLALIRHFLGRPVLWRGRI